MATDRTAGMAPPRLLSPPAPDPGRGTAALISVCRFNFLLRRTFIQWLHADLRAIGVAISQLEKRGIKTVDCRRAGLSSKELIPKLRQFHQHWKPPFQNDYSQDSAFQPYEQLMCLREDLEEALNQFAEPGQAVPRYFPKMRPISRTMGNRTRCTAGGGKRTDCVCRCRCST